jgi:hypothetical protein
MPRKPLLPHVPLKFKDLLDGVLKVKPPISKSPVTKKRSAAKPRPRKRR